MIQYDVFFYLNLNEFFNEEKTHKVSINKTYDNFTKERVFQSNTDFYPHRALLLYYKMITLQVEIMLQKKKYASHIYTECINTLLLIKLSYNVLASDSCVMSGRMELSVD